MNTFLKAAGFAALLASAEPVTAQTDSLSGLWAAELRPGAALRGKLVVQGGGKEWHATLAGARADFHPAGDAVRFAFPGNAGLFRGKLVQSARAIEGFWVQPPGPTNSYAMATPITLKSSGRNLWSGVVTPLEDRFTLYLKIFRDEKGALVGAFRNPELNSIGGASQFRVSRDGATVRFVNNSGGREISHEAILSGTPARLSINWPELGRTIALARRSPAEASAFFPRPAGAPQYIYRKPPAIGDGWATARAGETGIDEAAFTGVVRKLVDSDPAASRPDLIHSMLVAHRGKLIFEEYFFGYGRDTPHSTRSAGKTFSSVMLGAAMMDGVALAPETKVYDLLARRGPFANPDPRKSQVTLAHLMTHTAGLACDDNDDASPGNENRMDSQTGQPDWWQYTLDLPMANDPGSRYAYCSANINLVGGALTAGTGIWLPELFDRSVARPLSFGPYHWNVMPSGEGYLGGGAFLRPRDLLKVGQAYLDNGAWKERRIVPSAWVKRSTAPHVEISPATTGLDAEAFENAYAEGRDGYAWHLSSLTSGGRSYPTYQATGNGGQILVVIPELDLAAVFTGGNYRQFGIWGRWVPDIIGGAVIPALRP